MTYETARAAARAPFEGLTACADEHTRKAVLDTFDIAFERGFLAGIDRAEEISAEVKRDLAGKRRQDAKCLRRKPREPGRRVRRIYHARRCTLLVLSRRCEESIQIGPNITVKLLSIRGDKCRLGFDCPPEVMIRREELLDRMDDERDT